MTYGLPMGPRNSNELRLLVAHCFEMAEHGGDPELHASVRLVAEELEREAAEYEFNRRDEKPR